MKKMKEEEVEIMIDPEEEKEAEAEAEILNQEETSLMDFPALESQQTHKQNIYTKTRSFPIKNINTTWNTRQVEMREQPVGLNCHAL